VRLRKAATIVCGLALAAGGCGGPANVPGVAGSFAPDSVPEAFSRASGALIAPLATRGFLIDERGDLYDGEWMVRFAPTADGLEADPPQRIAAIDRWRPVLRWLRRAGDVHWEFEAVAVPERSPRDTVLVVSLRVRARNTGTVPHRADLTVSLTPPDSNPLFVAWDARDNPRVALRWAAGGRDTAVAWCGETVAGTEYASGAALAPGATFERRLLLPTYPTADRDLARHARVSHHQRVADALRAADQELAGGTTFELGDPETESALRAATLLLLASRERRGDVEIPIGNPFQYRDVWLRDGARVAHALAISGHGDVARRMVAGLARFQWPNGAFLSQRGQLDGSGQALWAFEQVLLRGATPETVDPYIESGTRTWRWIEWQRAAGRTSGTREDGRVQLLPFGAMLPYAEPRDNELVRAQLIGNDAWAIAGERALEHMLRSRGRITTADSVARDRTRYQQEFASALARTGRDDIPPSWQGIGRDWGNLTVGWPCGALPVDDPRVAATAFRVWSAAGGSGLTIYGHRDSLHGYIGADLATWALRAGRPDLADSVLRAMLHWRTASGTGGEIFTRTGDFGRNLPPHPTTAAGLIALVRNSLIDDDVDTLRLTLGANRSWWQGAKVKGAPTWWGPIDLEFRLESDRATWQWTPVPVWTVLTLPPGTRLVDSPAAPLVAAGNRVLAPPGTQEAHVRVATTP
jgi:hypothetical protein